MMSGLTSRRLSRSRASAQHLRRQIGDDDVGGGDELLDDLAAFRDGRVKGHPELVAVHRKKHRAAAIRSGPDRDKAAILAAADPLDADHFGPEIAEQCRAVRPRDIASEIEDSNAVEHTGHRTSPRNLPYTGNVTAYSDGAFGTPFPRLWLAG